MNLYATTIHAVNPKTGKLTKFVGPNIPAISYADAQDYCYNNGLGYCHADSILVEEIPVKDGRPDFENKIDYETFKSN